MSENKSIKDQAEDIRKELDELIGAGSGEISEVIETDVTLPVRREQNHVSFAQLKESSTKKAKKTITALMKFYLDEDIIERDEYIQAKKKMDEMTMSSLVYQLQAGERALTTLLDAIEDGDVAPRMFEVLATLQKSMLDIIKSQTMYLMATEESAKRIARDIEIYRKRDNIKEIEISGGDPSSGNVQRGTKDLMRMIREGIDAAETDVEDVEITE
jgi:organic radical activating enzyme